jgi:hypothetical protein
MKTEKKVYVAPKLAKLGDIGQVTQGSGQKSGSICLCGHGLN